MKLRKIIIFMFLYCGLSVQASEEQSIQEFVKETVQNLPMSNDTFVQDYMDPLVGGESIRTPNGTQFNVNVSCPSSNAFLLVFGQPGANGDLSLLQFSRDKDLDGTIDQIQNFPKPVSGVCANGLISCDTGTWNNCSGYKWAAENDNLSLVRASLSTLGGCYCINSSCGDSNKSTRMISSIVSDLGSSAATALAMHNPQYQISSAKTNNFEARFYGQKLQGCGAGSTPQLASYFTNSSRIAAQANIYKNDPNGIYQLIANSENITRSSVTTSRSCSIVREVGYNEVSVDDIISFNSGDGRLETCSGEGCLRLTVGNNFTGRWLNMPGRLPDRWTCAFGHATMSLFVGRPDKITSATLVGVDFKNWIRVHLNNEKAYAQPFPEWDGQSNPFPEWNGWSSSGDFCRQGAAVKTLAINVLDKFKQSGVVEFGVDVQTKRAGKGYAYIDLTVDNSCDVDGETFNDSCAPIKEDDKCVLKNESIDGVQTYLNYHPTGKTPIATTREIGGSSCDLSVTKGWWRVEREYECRTNIDLNFTEGLNRKNAIEESISSDSYQDLINGVSTQRSLGLSSVTIAPISACTNACKTKQKKDKVSVGNVGPVTTLSGQEYEILYRKCTGPSNTTCPLSEGETLITACSCLNEFGAASTMMQALRQAGQDLVCTTGERQSF